MEQQLTVIRSLAKARFQRQSFRGDRVHVSRIKLIVVTSSLLRSVESRPRVFQETLAIAGSRRKQTDPAARGCEDLLAVQIEGRFQHSAARVNDFDPIPALANRRQENARLLTPEPRYRVALSDGKPQR